MKTIHVTTPEVEFDILVPAAQQELRAAEVAMETDGIVTVCK